MRLIGGKFPDYGEVCSTRSVALRTPQYGAVRIVAFMPQQRRITLTDGR
jgi:hypothetical protein